jgi:xanthine dehydrogenase YagT iron-sulfur-binding subunit
MIEVQRAFWAQDAFQCGFCTPGQVMSAVACIREGYAGSPEDIREWMSGVRPWVPRPATGW